MEKQPNVERYLTDVELPVTWRPSARWEIWEKKVLQDYDKATADWLLKHYIIDSKAHNATVYVMSVNNHRELFSDNYHNDYDEMITIFERDCLGMDNRQEFGYYTSPAGFDGGNYPTELIANQVGLNSSSFVDYAKNNIPSNGYFVVKTGSFLVPVVNRLLTEDKTFVTGIMELTDIGENTLEMLLRAYELACDQST